jgi:hypothetical protein
VRDNWGDKSFHSTRPEEAKYRRCSAPGCEAKFDDHMWGSMKAQREGWFLQKNGDAWCPDHIPDWVEAWRSRQRRKS